MADIVQLVENGEKKFLKTHIKAVEGFDEVLEELKEEIHPAKAEWVKLVYDSAIEVDNSMPAEIIKTVFPDGTAMVSFRGRCKRLSGNFGVAGINVCTVPPEYRPKQNAMMAVSGNSGNIGRCQFTPSGTVEVATNATGMSEIRLDGCFYFLD